VWGRASDGSGGLVVLEVAQGKLHAKQGGVVQVTDILFGEQVLDSVVDVDEWVAWYPDRIRIGERDLLFCTLTLDELSQVVGLNLMIEKVNAYFTDAHVLLHIYLDDGSVAEVEVNRFTCSVRRLRLVRLADDDDEVGPGFSSFVRRLGDTAFEVYEFSLMEDHRERWLQARAAYYESLPDGFGEPLQLFRSGRVTPPEEDAMGRTTDMDNSELNPDEGDKSQGTSSAWVYAVAPNPPAIHAFKLTTQDSGCVPNPTRLCLNDGRFGVEASYTTTQGGPDEASAVHLTADTGYLSFFDPDNVEVMLKVLDGCGVNQHYWVFAAGLTDVEVEMTVTDTSTGDTKTYTNTLGEALRPILDVEAFAGCGDKGWTEPPGGLRPAEPAMATKVLPSLQGCDPQGDALCLNGDRFRVTATWETSDGSTGSAQALPITADTGTFWFFDDDNVEVVLKVLDGCGINQRYWVFAGGLTDVRVELTVEDTVSGEVRIYTNPLGGAFLPIQDMEAFATCP